MEGLSLLTHSTQSPPAVHMCQFCPFMVPKQGSNAEWASFARCNKSCLRWDDDNLSHSLSYQSRRCVLWEGIRAGDTLGCRAVAWKSMYSPMPRRASRNFSASTGEQNLSGSFWEAFSDSHQSTPAWKPYCCWSRQLLRLKPGLSPNCLEGCGSATLRARRPYGAQMMYNSNYLGAWSSDVSLAGKRDNFPLNSSYDRWQCLCLLFCGNAAQSCVEGLCRQRHRMMISSFVTA